METAPNPAVLHLFSEWLLRPERFPSRQRAVRNRYRLGCYSTFTNSVTRCDRLDAAFAELERSGIVSRANFTCCSKCGENEIGDAMAEAAEQGIAVRGYTFFHQQDIDRAVAGDGVLLKYGPNPYDEKRRRGDRQGDPADCVSGA